MKTIIYRFLSALFLLTVFVFAADAQTADNSNKTENTAANSVQNERLKIIKKPRTSGSVSGKCLTDFGFADLYIRVKVTFHSSGKVTAAEIVKSSGCDYFDKEGLKVAGKIKFKPEIKDGQTVTITKLIEYTSRIY